MADEKLNKSLPENKDSSSDIDIGEANRVNAAMEDQEAGNDLEESVGEMSLETDNISSSGRLGSKNDRRSNEPGTSKESLNIALPEVCST